LDQAERDTVRALLNSSDFVDKAPATVYHELLDEGTYVASVSSMYRILRAHGEVRERRRQAVHPARVKPELVATQPNQCWSWDITKLHGRLIDVVRLAGQFRTAGGEPRAACSEPTAALRGVLSELVGIVSTRTTHGPTNRSCRLAERIVAIFVMKSPIRRCPAGFRECNTPYTKMVSFHPPPSWVRYPACGE
jgi:hypothetical protein